MFSLFRKITAAEMLQQQQEDAHKAYLEHLVQAENHQTLAEMYKARMERVSKMINANDPNVDLPQPINMITHARFR